MFKNKLIFVLCAIGISLFMSSKVMAANYAPYVQRICGDDRYATAIEVSKNGWANGSEYAVLANGQNFPDALSAAPLAKKYNAPILLNPDSDLDSRVENELQRLGVKQIFIIGGPSVISDNIKNKLEGLNIKTTRLWGQNRYETSIKIAEQLDFNGQVVVANGENFPDALSIAPIAAQKSMPIIITPSNTLPEAVANYIKNNKITKSYIIGESDVISNDVVGSFPNSERIAGSNRYTTNAVVINKFKSELNFQNSYLASGENFPDALSGSALAAKNSSAIALVNGSLGATTKTTDNDTRATIVFLSQSKLNCKFLNVLGGNDVVNDNLAYAIPIGQYESANNNDSSMNPVIEDIAIDGDWVYYYEIFWGRCLGSDDQPVRKSLLRKVKKDLTGYTTIVDTSNYSDGYPVGGQSCTISKIKDGWIYYGNNKDCLFYIGDDTFFKVRVDGTENTRLSGNPDYS